MDRNVYLAEMGYGAYGRTTGKKNYLGKEMPSWDDLPAPQKKTWINASAAIRRRVVN